MVSFQSKFICLFLTCCLFAGCQRESSDSYQGYVDGDVTFIASPFSGDLIELSVQEGDKVQKGQWLAQLELEPQQSQLEQANYALESAQKTLENLQKGERQAVVAGIQAEIDKAQSELSLAKVRRDRAQTLYEKNLIEKDALDEASTQYNTKLDTVKQLKAKLEEATLGERIDVIAAQKAQVLSAKSKVKELSWALEAKKLDAPMAGSILDTFYKKGEFVPASKPIMSMLAPENQYIVFFLPLAKMSAFRLQDTVWIDCEGCAQRAKALISYISPQVEFTPPLIFSRQHEDKYVYRLHARVLDSKGLNFHLGQPVYVWLNEATP